jgi:lysozyme
MQKVSARGLAEIAAHEGIVTSPYLDSVGVWTVGVGHTAGAGAPDPAKNRREFSVPEIMEIFEKDVGKFEARVRKAFTRQLTQAQFDAAVSFDFNTGGILKATWVKQFNAGQDAAQASFMNWSKPKEIIPRREKERDLFFDGKYSSNGMATLYPANAIGQVQWGQGKRVNVLILMQAGGQRPTPVPNPTLPKAAIDGPKDDETQVVIVKTPKPDPKTPAAPPANTGLIAIATIILAFLAGIARYIFGG